uniref:Uncharacterized protein n=1 Tax=Arundo donax TaxID=35708 RepID=A0A0A9DBN3_ARUDO
MKLGLDELHLGRADLGRLGRAHVVEPVRSSGGERRRSVSDKRLESPHEILAGPGMVYSRGHQIQESTQHNFFSFLEKKIE